jgi:hypothetical protein
VSEAAIILTNGDTRATAKRWIDNAPDLTRITFKRNRRSLPQNDRMWAMLTDIATQATWHGKKRTTKVWKDLFSAAVLTAAGGIEVVPGLDGGIMLVGLRTSEMTVAQMADLITYMESWGAQNGVTFSDPESSASRAAEGGSNNLSADAGP